MAAIAKIQLYIHIVKGVEVDLQPELERELENELLQQAYSIASDYLTRNRIQIKYVRDGTKRNWRRKN